MTIVIRFYKFYCNSFVLAALIAWFLKAAQDSFINLSKLIITNCSTLMMENEICLRCLERFKRKLSVLISFKEVIECLRLLTKDGVISY